MLKTSVILSLVIAGILASAQNPAAPPNPEPKMKKVPARYITPASGREMFVAYCASCHGNDGKGNGPVASALKDGVPDLAQLSAKNKGSFPEDHVISIIQGRTVTPAHGSMEMPVWGPVFLNLDNQSEAVVQQRARNLAKYIESLQASHK